MIAFVEISVRRYPRPPVMQDSINAIISLAKITFRGLNISFIITNITLTDNNGFINVCTGESLMLVYFMTERIFKIIITKNARVEPIIAPPILNCGMGMRMKFAKSFIIIPIKE